MTRAYSEDLRIRVIRAVEAGASRRSVAFKYAVSISFVIKLVQRWRVAGTVAPRGTGGRKHMPNALASHERPRPPLCPDAVSGRGLVEA